MQELRVQIVTPDGTVYDAAAREVVLPTLVGQIAILPNHVPLISRLQAGEIIIKKDGGDVHVAVSTGLIEVRPGSVVYIVADTAERAEHIDEARASAAHERAQTLLREAESLDDVAFAAVQAKIEKEFARVSVARRRSSSLHITTPKNE